ncbi:MAG: chromosome segregation ATPase [Cyanobacteria bacterium J06635_1]
MSIPRKPYRHPKQQPSRPSAGARLTPKMPENGRVKPRFSASKVNRPRPPQGQPSTRSRPLAQESPTVVADVNGASVEAADRPKGLELRGLLNLQWMKSWQFLLISTIAVLTGSMAFALTSLFRIPNLPNCRAIFWPTASASLRLQCAESYADQGTVDFLLDAIDLVDHLPQNHALRGEIDARIEGWAEQILILADRSFQSGELDSAIATARKIPPKTAAADRVESRIRKWQRTWNDASEIYETAKKRLTERKFQEAFSATVRLLDVGNDYWRRDKYNELTKLIILAREDSAKIGKAKQASERGSIDSYKEALKLLNSISEESVLYADAQKAKKGVIKDMMRLAEVFLERQKLSQAERILKEVPRNAGYDSEIADFQVFIDAYQRAWAGDALSLDGAITRLQSLGRDRPLYGRAQTLMAQWRSELQALAQLDRARQIAAGGNVADLAAGIVEAQKIPRGNPRWEDAAPQIRRWRERIETIEDQPILTRADQLANPGTPDALRAAIQEANQIGSGRKLSEQANTRIRNWRRRIQQIEDQPLLEQARSQAASGDLAGAISTASRIGSGRALYDDAQADISDWQIQTNSAQWLRDAYTAAESGSSRGLANAISIASQIPRRGSNYSEASGQIDRWSWDLLNIAERSALSDPGGAIAIAQQIPSGTAAYGDAQQRISNWQAAQNRITDPLELTPSETAPDSPNPSDSEGELREAPTPSALEDR